MSNPQPQSQNTDLPWPGRQWPQALLRALPGPPGGAAAADAPDELPGGATGEDQLATGESTGDGLGLLLGGCFGGMGCGCAVCR